MSLPSDGLDAFLAVANTRHFTKAAKQLFLTQSALSKRIQVLESAVQCSLFVRTPKSVRLTEAGERLLQYCHARQYLESQVTSALHGNEQGPIRGFIGIAAYSTVARSIVLPSLAVLSEQHPGISFKFLTREVGELEDLVSSGEVDFAVSLRKAYRPTLSWVHLGNEVNVLVERRGHKGRNVYLDHDADDTTTARFLELQINRVDSYAREYFDEVYSIMDAVANGMGRAVIPKHLALTDPRLRVVPKFKPLIEPVYLLFRRYDFEPPVYEAIRAHLKKAFLKALPNKLSNPPGY